MYVYITRSISQQPARTMDLSRLASYEKKCSYLTAVCSYLLLSFPLFQLYTRQLNIIHKYHGDVSKGLVIHNTHQAKDYTL